MTAFRKSLFSLLTSLSLFSFTAQAQQQNQHRFDPPWNTPPSSAVNFTIEGIDNIPDLYGEVVNPQLIIFFAGNQFMVVDELIKGFKAKYPQVERVFVETLPPGILARQIQGGSLTIGNMRITHMPDIYTAGKGKIEEMQNIFDRVETYAYNDLSLMVQKGNPKQIKGLSDLSDPNIKISMPNPEWEGIAKQIQAAYKNAGGDALNQSIMQNKVKNNSTRLTRIHHRESPLAILNKQVDVAPVWSSEVKFQQLIGHPVDEVKIPENQNVRATYQAARLKSATHKQYADLFLDYLTSEEGKAIYAKYGFQVD